MSDDNGQKREFTVKGFRMAANSILVETLPPRQVTDGGIHIPDAHQQERKIGRVLAIPEGLAADECPYLVDDYVMYCDGAGKTVGIEGRDDLLVLQWCGEIADDILGYWPESDLPTASETR